MHLGGGSGVAEADEIPAADRVEIDAWRGGNVGLRQQALGLENLLEADEEAAEPVAQRLLEEREAARSARDFDAADAKRDELAALGWEVRDTSEGPRLVRRS